MSKLRYIIYLMVLAVLSGCTDDLNICTDVDVDINAGDEIGFVAHVPQPATRATAEEDAYWEHINKFERVKDDYVFDVEMYEEGNATKIASATYNPTKNTVNNVTTYDDYGTLEETDKYLWWPSTAKRYAFHAVSSNSATTLVTKTENGQHYSDQTDKDKFFVQDRIEGYGYVPGWDQELNEGNGAPVRDLDKYNYMTAKEWYAANKAWGTPEGMTNAQLVEHWKKVPLFMRHKRSRITVLLKAGEGVEREQVKYDRYLTPENIHTEIYSYDKDNNQTIVQPLLGSYKCEYEATNLLPKEDVTTACYDAIVNPHDYTAGDNMTEQKILQINLSGMKFSFCASNDVKYSSAVDAENEDVKMRYNLTEGKHLILEVTLSTDTRKILITAYVVDWEDWPFSSICDDFGQAADPIAINDKADLIEFLEDNSRNKAGNVGVIIPVNFNLNEAVTGEMINKKHLVNDPSGKKPGDPGYTTTYEAGYNPKPSDEIVYNAGWEAYSNYDLKATLKLAGATITTNQCLFGSIAVSGSVVNGTIQIADGQDNEPDFECAVAKSNYGTVERVTVLQGETTRKATRAGLVTTNYGTIYACTSQMPVYNAGGSSETLIGGIAAVMEFPLKADGSVDESAMPVIRQCIVNARIDGGEKVKGGGIVGSAMGKVTDNTFEYGITLLQDPDNFKNILYAKGNQSTQNLEHSGNEWPTFKEYSVGNNGGTLINARPEPELFNQVIDSQKELTKLVSDGTYNNTTSRHRIAGSFTVDDSWELGVQNSSAHALMCELDGNDKTITLTGTANAQMLFGQIQSHLYDLVLQLDKPIVVLPNASASRDEDKLPARAPLAYAVVGSDAVVRNVKVRAAEDVYVQSTAASGLVVWAYGGATIEDCQSNVDVRIALPDGGTGTQQVYFVGGLVNTAAKANILRCTYMCDNFNVTEEENAAPGKNIYYGGIVGGTNSNGFETPSLNISDCASWVTWETTDALPHAAWGGIIGYSKYQNSFKDLVNATDGKCQGNWWAAPTGASGQGMASGMNEEKVIGKKNSVQPTKDLNY